MGEKKNKHLVSSKSVGRNVLLMREIRAELVRLVGIDRSVKVRQITIHYKHDKQKSFSEGIQSRTLGQTVSNYKTHPVSILSDKDRNLWLQLAQTP